MEWNFRVRLADVSARQLVSSERTPTSQPIFRADFDGKRISSEMCMSAGDPSWLLKCSFQYRLMESSLEKVVESLSNRTFNIDVLFVEPRGSAEFLVGTARVDLYSIATGPTSYHLRLMHAKSPVSCGEVSFTLQMEQQTVSMISFPHPSASPDFLVQCPHV